MKDLYILSYREIDEEYGTKFMTAVTDSVCWAEWDSNKILLDYLVLEEDTKQDVDFYIVEEDQHLATIFDKYKENIEPQLDNISHFNTIRSKEDLLTSFLDYFGLDN